MFEAEHISWVNIYNIIYVDVICFYFSHDNNRDGCLIPMGLKQCSHGQDVQICELILYTEMIDELKRLILES